MAVHRPKLKRDAGSPRKPNDKEHMIVRVNAHDKHAVAQRLRK
jgi:hypothetical protein